jgi:hypothetical protein
MIALTPVLSGCGGGDGGGEDTPDPFVFRRLDLRQNDPEGRPAWDLKSPEARYSADTRRVEARSPSGTIYDGGEPRFEVSARQGTVLNDGERIILSGAVRIRRLGDRPLLILAPEIVWIPGEDRMEIARDPLALDRDSRLKAESARFLVSEERLELRGRPTLERWQDREGDDPITPESTDPEVVVETGPVAWTLSDGALQAKGPVRGVRQVGEEERPPQTLRASALRGNTREGYVDLMAPVQVVDPGEKATMEGVAARWQFREQVLSSAGPFQARIGATTIRGRGYRVVVPDSQVRIQADCDLTQPGERLQARSCLWNWEKSTLLARGSVRLRRKENDQLTTAEELQGRIGDDGRAEFRTPGGRVNSRLRVPRKEERPEPRGQGSGDGERPSGPAPVEF